MNYALRTHQLSKTYANGVTALKGVDLAVEQGDFYALLGPNGAGKSTVIGILCSLVNKTAGNVEIFGVDIDRDFAQAKSTSRKQRIAKQCASCAQRAGPALQPFSEYRCAIPCQGDAPFFCLLFKP